jgi:hypothetical protein
MFVSHHIHFSVKSYFPLEITGKAVGTTLALPPPGGAATRRTTFYISMTIAF